MEIVSINHNWLFMRLVFEDPSIMSKEHSNLCILIKLKIIHNLQVNTILILVKFINCKIFQLNGE